MKLKLRVLSPVHIGSGEELQPLDYVVEGKTFYRIDMGRVFDDPGFDRDRFMEFVTGKNPYFGELDAGLGMRNSSYRLEAHFDTTKPRSVKEFVKTGGMLYVPGSSIKGSVLSALYWHTLWERACDDDEIWSIVASCLRKKPLTGLKSRYVAGGRDAQKETLDSIVFDSISTQSEVARGSEKKFARWLQVSDSTTTGEGFVGVCVIQGSNRPHVLMELLKSGVTLDFSMEPLHSRFSMKEIVNITHDFYSRVLEEEMEWCESNKVEVEPVKGNSLIRLGQGSSSLSTSLLMLAEDFEGEGEKGIVNDYTSNWRVTKYGTPPKTRKFVAIGRKNYSMGWADLVP